MPDPQKNAGTGKGSSKEIPMEARVLLACVLVILVLFITPYIYKTPQPGPVQKAPNPKPAVAAQAPPPAATPAPPPQTAANTTAEKPVAPISAGAEQTYTINTDLYVIQFSNRGAVVKSWILKKYRDGSGKPLELVNLATEPTTGAPFEFQFAHKPTSDPNTALFAATPSADNLGIDFRYSDGHTVFQKSFQFGRDSYLSEITFDVQENGQDVPSELVWRGGFG